MEGRGRGHGSGPGGAAHRGRLYGAARNGRDVPVARLSAGGRRRTRASLRGREEWKGGAGGTGQGRGGRHTGGVSTGPRGMVETCRWHVSAPGGDAAPGRLYGAARNGREGPGARVRAGGGGTPGASLRGREEW